MISTLLLHLLNRLSVYTQNHPQFNLVCLAHCFTARQLLLLLMVDVAVTENIVNNGQVGVTNLQDILLLFSITCFGLSSMVSDD
jgi:hypothetical protein